MTLENFKESIETLANRERFRAFIIELCDGQKFELDFPRALAYRGGVAAYVFSGGEPIRFDHTDLATMNADIA